MHEGEGMTIDVMPGATENALLIFVVGRLKVSGCATEVGRRYAHEPLKLS